MPHGCHRGQGGVVTVSASAFMVLNLLYAQNHAHHMWPKYNILEKSKSSCTVLPGLPNQGRES